MVNLIRYYCAMAICLGPLQLAQAQNTPLTFNKRLIIPLEAGLGYNSENLKSLISLQVSPQAAFIEKWPKVRLGGTLGGAYTLVPPEQSREGWTGYAGPKVSYYLSTFFLKIGDSPLVFGNLSIYGEHLWGGNNVKLFGIGLSAEIVKKVTFSAKIHRDYMHAVTWLQLGTSFNLFPKKKEQTSPSLAH